MTLIIVCDTGPLLHLSEAGAVHLLPIAGEILIPPLVAVEFEQNAQGWKPPQWAKVNELNNTFQNQAAKWTHDGRIHAGEAAAIALALQTRADWLLTDDARARQFSETLKLEVHGSLGLLLWSVATGRINDHVEALNLLSALSNSSLWVSERVLREAKLAIEKLLPKI